MATNQPTNQPTNQTNPKLRYSEGCSASERPLPTASVKRLSLDAIDVENDTELDALTAQVLAAGNKIAESERVEMIRKVLSTSVATS